MNLAGRTLESSPGVAFGLWPERFLDSGATMGDTLDVGLGGVT